MLQIPLETSKKHLTCQQLHVPSPLSYIENLIYDILTGTTAAPDSVSSHRDSMISDEFRVDLQCLYISMKSQILAVELTPLLPSVSESINPTLQERVDAKIESTRQTCRSFVEQLQVSSTSLNMRVWCAYLEFELSLPNAKCGDICKLGDKLLKALAAYISSLPQSTDHPTLGSETGAVLTSNILVAIPGSLHLHWQLIKTLVYLPPTLRPTSYSPHQHSQLAMFTSFIELVERLIQAYQISLTVNSCQGHIKTVSPTGLEPTTLTVTTPYTYHGTLKPSSSSDKKKKDKSTINSNNSISSSREVKVMQDINTIVKVEDVTCMNGSYQLLIMVSNRYLLLLTNVNYTYVFAHVMYIHILHILMYSIWYVCIFLMLYM